MSWRISCESEAVWRGNSIGNKVLSAMVRTQSDACVIHYFRIERRSRPGVAGAGCPTKEQATFSQSFACKVGRPIMSRI
jgi:hypothetical protein